jgi:hypothetical protein
MPLQHSPPARTQQFLPTPFRSIPFPAAVDLPRNRAETMSLLGLFGHFIPKSAPDRRSPAPA